MKKETHCKMQFTIMSGALALALMGCFEGGGGADVSDSDFLPSNLPKLSSSQVDRAVAALEAVGDTQLIIMVAGKRKKGQLMTMPMDTRQLEDKCAFDVQNRAYYLGTREGSASLKVSGADCAIDLHMTSDIANNMEKSSTTFNRRSTDGGTGPLTHLAMTGRVHQNDDDYAGTTKGVLKLDGEVNEVKATRKHRVTITGDVLKTEEKVLLEFDDFTFEYIVSVAVNRRTMQLTEEARKLANGEQASDRVNDCARDLVLIAANLYL